MTACPDSPVGRDPGKVSVSQPAQHGPRHLVGLGQERERCVLVIALEADPDPVRVRAGWVCDADIWAMIAQANTREREEVPI